MKNLTIAFLLLFTISSNAQVDSTGIIPMEDIILLQDNSTERNLRVTDYGIWQYEPIGDLHAIKTLMIDSVDNWYSHGMDDMWLWNEYKIECWQDSVHNEFSFDDLFMSSEYYKVELVGAEIIVSGTNKWIVLRRTPTAEGFMQWKNRLFIEKIKR